MADPIVIDEARQKAGRKILALTDRAGFDAYAAGRLHDRQTGTWRYLLVTPMLKSHGPRWIYERLLKVFRYHPLPEGVTPLDVYVMDPAMEIAAFGEPFLAMDDRENSTGVGILLTHDVKIDDSTVSDGFVTFYRRLPASLRVQRRDPARKFDLRVRQLEAA